MNYVDVINEYYTNLDYDNNKEKVLKEISHLSETLKFDKSVDILARLNTMVNTIQKNISLFKSLCRHVDIIDTILEHLTVYGFTIQFYEDETAHEYRWILLILFILFNICKEPAIYSFLLHLFFPNITPEITEDIPKEVKSLFNLDNFEKEMIILEDSDLYAVINCLIITDEFPNFMWVQEQVKEKFLWIMNRHHSKFTVHIKFPMKTFQSLKDIQFRVRRDDVIHVVSIWSEDIIAAKNFALSLNSRIVFINTHMDFSDGVTFAFYKQLFNQTTSQKAFRKIYENKLEEERDSPDIEQNENVIHLSRITEINFTSICNLFYDGMWQEPIKGMYWKHNNNLWANATNDDIIRCCESAERGYKTWSIKSIKTRIQILSKLMSILKLNNKHILAAIVERWLKFPYLFNNIQGYRVQTKMIEITELYEPLGIFVLREENENILFFRLMQTLIAGNSVIVMFDANFCNLIPYCDMFSTCGIPSGVINLLSHKDISMLEHKLCSEKYVNYAKTFFLKNDSKDTYILTYLNLTIPKKIVLHLE